jgi:hypothetical protein
LSEGWSPDDVPSSHPLAGNSRRKEATPTNNSRASLVTRNGILFDPIASIQASHGHSRKICADIWMPGRIESLKDEVCGIRSWVYQQLLTRDKGTQLQVVTAGAVAGLVSRYLQSFLPINLISILINNPQILRSSPRRYKNPSPTPDPLPQRPLKPSSPRRPNLQRHIRNSKANPPRRRHLRIMERKHTCRRPLPLLRRPPIPNLPHNISIPYI